MTQAAEAQAELRTAPEAAPKARPARSKPTKVLPTERIAFGKQLDLLRAYAAASGTAGKPVTNKEVADFMKMADTTASTANTFFCALGFLQRTENGFVPNADVTNFSRAWDWKPENASHELAPSVRASWFGELLLPKLAFGPIEEDEALARLAQASAAGPEHRNPLRLCLDYMEAANLIVRDGSIIRLNRNAPQSQPEIPPAQQEAVPTDRIVRGGTQGALSTSFEQQGGDVVRFNIAVNVDLAEMRDWPPERIAAFFAGIAQVLAAKGGLERKTAT